MIRKLRIAARLSPRDWMLLLQAWIWLLVFDLGLRTRSFSSLQTFAAKLAAHPTQPSEQTGELIRSLIVAVEHARYNHLYPMTCLRRALTLQKLLAQNGISADLKVGVHKDGRQLSAHAWLEYQGKPLGEPEKITEKFSVLQKHIHR